MIIHKGLLESGRWFKMSMVEQLANVACDIERTIRWRNAGDIKLSSDAFDRALELIDFTIADPKNKHRLREVVRARELLVDHFMYDNIYESTDEEWQKYFMWISWLAAIRRGR